MKHETCEKAYDCPNYNALHCQYATDQWKRCAYWQRRRGRATR